MAEASPDKPHSAWIVGEMYKQYKDGNLYDFTIETKDGDIHCHRLILASAFRYFSAMFEANSLLGNISTKSNLHFFDTSSIRKLIEFAYTGEIDLRVDVIEPLVKAAGYLQCDRVMKECDKYLASLVSKLNCMKWYTVASEYSLPQTSKTTYRQVITFFTELIHTDSFVEMHPKDLQGILNDDMLNVESEDHVVEALLVWCSHESNERSQITQELLAHVRFNYCTLDFLKSVNTDPKFDCICTPRFRRYVRHALQHRTGKLCGPRSKKQSWTTSQQPRFSFSKNKLLLIGGHAKKLIDFMDTNLRSCCVWNRTDQEWCKFTELPPHYDQCFEWTVTVASDRFFVTGGYHTTDRQTGDRGDITQTQIQHPTRDVPTSGCGVKVNGIVVPLCCVADGNMARYLPATFSTSLEA